eukprot:Tbor_TRINITY_DN1898_c0_g1::TRINITY_DN1898_c0_g1_i1::g.23086::m.23086
MQRLCGTEIFIRPQSKLIPVLLPHSHFPTYFRFFSNINIDIQYRTAYQDNLSTEKNEKRSSLKWMTKSSREFLQEGDKERAAKNPEKQKAVEFKDKEKRIATEMYIKNDELYENEISKLTDFKGPRIKKSVAFFKRQGLAFIIIYASTYIGCFVALYYALTSNFVSKVAWFKWGIMMTGQNIADDTISKQVEEWDTYINLGLTFVINEILEVFRLPLVMVSFFTFRPTIIRMGKLLKVYIFKSKVKKI